MVVGGSSNVQNKMQTVLNKIVQKVSPVKLFICKLYPIEKNSCIIFLSVYSINICVMVLSPNCEYENI